MSTVDDRLAIYLPYVCDVCGVCGVCGVCVRGMRGRPTARPARGCARRGTRKEVDVVGPIAATNGAPRPEWRPVASSSALANDTEIAAPG